MATMKCMALLISQTIEIWTEVAICYYQIQVGFAKCPIGFWERANKRRFIMDITYFKPWWNFKFGAAVFLHNVSPVWPLEWHLVSALRVEVFNLKHRGQPYGCPSSLARSLEMAWSFTTLVMTQSTPPAIMVRNLWYPVGLLSIFPSDILTILLKAILLFIVLNNGIEISTCCPMNYLMLSSLQIIPCDQSFYTRKCTRYYYSTRCSNFKNIFYIVYFNCFHWLYFITSVMSKRYDKGSLFYCTNRNSIRTFAIYSKRDVQKIRQSTAILFSTNMY